MDLKNLAEKRDSLDLMMDDAKQKLSENAVRINLFKKREYRYKNKRSTSPANAFNRMAIKARKDSLRKFFNDSAKTPPITFDTADQDQQTADTVATDAIVELVDLDSLYSVFTLREQVSILTNAKTLTRTAKNYIDNTKTSLETRQKLVRRFEIEWHRKFTIAFACLVFLFIGAPLGAIIRKGGLGLPLILSTLFFILYYILSLTGEKLVRESILQDYQGMWMTSGIFMIAGVFITYQATTDSSILNFDTYSNYFKKIFGQKYNLVDVLAKDKKTLDDILAKKSNINSALNSLLQDIDSQITTVDELFNVGDFLISVFTMQGLTNLRLFERLYKNIMRSIINHPLFDNRRVRSKLLEFPDFSYKSYQDSGFKLVLKVIIAIIPGVNFILIIKHYIMLGNLKRNLKHIRTLTEELKTTIKLAEDS